MHFNMKSKGDSHARTSFAEVMTRTHKRTVEVPHRWSAIARNALLSRLYGVNGSRGPDGKFVSLGAVLHANGMLSA